MASSADSKVLKPLPKPPGRRPIKEKYYDRRVKHQLDSDEKQNGPITQANAHNREDSLLFRLPAELRNVIWQLAMTPNLSEAQFYSDYGPRPAPEYTCSVSIFCRSGNAYPTLAIVLACRDIYRETRTMYSSIISQFYPETPWHLDSPGFIEDVSSSFETKFIIPRANRRKINSLKDPTLQRINDFMIYDRRKAARPQLIFKNGAWRGRWRDWQSPDLDGFAVRHIILYEKSKQSTMKNLMQQKYGQIFYEQLRDGKCCGAVHPYKHHIEALLIPPSIYVTSEALDKVRATAGLLFVTKEVIEAMLYIQVYTSGRYTDN